VGHDGGIVAVEELIGEGLPRRKPLRRHGGCRRLGGGGGLGVLVGDGVGVGGGVGVAWPQASSKLTAPSRMTSLRWFSFGHYSVRRASCQPGKIADRHGRTEPVRSLAAGMVEVDVA